MRPARACKPTGRVTARHSHPGQPPPPCARRLQFEAGGVVGATIDTYLLEKSRLLCNTAKERTFHIFYQLLAASPQERTILHTTATAESWPHPHAPPTRTRASCLARVCCLTPCTYHDLSAAQHPLLTAQRAHAHLPHSSPLPYGMRRRRSRSPSRHQLRQPPPSPNSRAPPPSRPTAAYRRRPCPSSGRHATR